MTAPSSPPEGTVHADELGPVVLSLDRRGVVRSTSSLDARWRGTFGVGSSVFLLPPELQWVSALVATALGRTAVKPTEGRVAARRCLVTVEPLYDAAGAVSGAVMTITAGDSRSALPATDDDELARARRRALLAEAESAAQAKKVRLLADISLAFAEAGVDYEVIVETIARRLTESVGDGCIIRLLSDDKNVLELLAFYHRDAARLAEGRRVLEGSPQRADDALFGEVLRTGQSRLIVAPGQSAVVLDKDPDYRAFLASFSSVSLVPLRLGGDVAGTIALLRDRGSSPSNMDDLALLEDLAERAALALEIGRLFREAQDAIRVRDDFLFLAGHELKTPLTSAKLRIQQLRRLASTLARTEETAEHSRSIERGLMLLERLHGRLDRRMDELLDVSRLREGSLPLRSQEVDLGDLTERVVARHRESAERAGSPLNARRQSDVVGQWDADRLEQLLANLLTNAIKFGAGAPILVTVERKGGYAWLTVSDQGVGITAADQARVFDRFERAVSSGHYGGFGLGLYMAAQIAHAHDGNIRVESTPGEGATFIVELPLRHERGHLQRDRLRRPRAAPAPPRSR